VGSHPEAVAVGDFTGNGITDLVVANFASASVSVLLGKGDGTFLPAKSYEVDGYPAAVAVGDFNHDGKFDIVTANTPVTGPQPGSVSVLLGNGDGTFQPARNYDLPDLATGSQTPLSVAVGDFNKDGKLDLVVTADTYIPGTPGYWTYGPYGSEYFPPVAAERNGYVNVLIGNGAGWFSADHSYALRGDLPTSVAVGDFRGNGNLDLAVTDGPGVGVLLGNGDGTLGAETRFATGSSPHSVAVGDFDGDNTPDLVTVNGKSVSVLLGKGDGTFGTAANYNTGGGAPVSVAVADINRDGNLDIVAAGGSTVPGPGYASVLLGNGNGTFQASQNFAAGNEPLALAVGDFNRDGWPDVVTVNPAFDEVSAGTVAVLLNAADWPGSSQATRFAMSGFPSPVAAGTTATFTITAQTASGTTATNYTGTVHFTTSDPRAVLPADYTFNAADAGVHAFSVTLRSAGSQSLTATDRATKSLTGTQGAITVIPAAASKLSVTTFPTPITAGMAGSFIVTARDPYGNIATSYKGTVHFASSDRRASLPGYYTFTAGDAGVHTFSATLKTAGTQWITARDTTTASVAGTNAGITVNPSAAAQFLIGAPWSVTCGTKFSLTLEVADAYGNVVGNYAGTVQFRSTDGRATLPNNDTFTEPDKGVHIFTGLVMRKKRRQTVTITDRFNSRLTGSAIVDVV
jgi:hypothetical protein